MSTPIVDIKSPGSPRKEEECENSVSLPPIETDTMDCKETEGPAKTAVQDDMGDLDELRNLQLLDEACQASRKRKQPENDDRGEKKSRKKVEKKQHKRDKAQRKKDHKKPRASRRDPLFEYNPDICQLPTAADFVGYSSLPREHWHFGPAPEPQVTPTSDDDEEFVSAPPRIPDPLDDTRRGGRGGRGKPVLKQAVDEVEDVGGEDGDDIESEDDPDDEKWRSAPADKETKSSRFMNIPSELREEIYHYILVVDAPILVRAGWKRVYARSRPGIDTAILRVNKLVYDEATRILYGKNTLLYRLRDPTNRVINLWELSGIDYKEKDAPNPEDADDDDDDDVDDEVDPNDGEFIPGGDGYDAEDEDVDEYPPRRGRARGQSRRNGRTRAKNDTIDVVKFGCYFRQLIVEAERNRFSNETQVAMAEAIKVFTAQPGRLRKTCSGGVKTNIRTFTIRIAPKYQLADQPQGRFTFVDFFKPQSPVWSALKSLPCRFVRIDISTAFLNGGKDPRFCRLTIDMQSLRFSRFAARQRSIPGAGNSWRADLWKGDKIIEAQRKAKSARCLAALDALAGHVTNACDKHLAEDIKAAVELYEEEEEYDQGMDWGSEHGGNHHFEEFVPEIELPGGVDGGARDQGGQDQEAS